MFLANAVPGSDLRLIRMGLRRGTEALSHLSGQPGSW